ncbi:MAG: phosphate/phosphite/phosphonate ABC transporter substrate-binding protein [gamma proteobacterium symbiont of Bathyaustriella thionipta]|nr:phosphate/phosphite/phosphonate ABC transporter substrate-binding protein [gamma proteobacterium symbiont of Bathyaustriella thionipta]MCU7951025.1 phosphate/phosphite/phosphonate ABC transporter substrate-binding protein [gamma proteobacterium symbiont of Bathyaustriella thionipta]MCU7953982.1 phosphate/phosphite/phosphonate ABC transporter substrate-binding protein [gamma proteobacterium symbiont of Bathyaustriella thionipta]MCU7957533.1 phosphate/phosphite/phosphonate ABC transporter subst
MIRFKCKISPYTVFLLLLITCLSPALAHDAQKKLIFGIHPYLNATNLIERFTPLVDYLSEKMDMSIHIRVGSSYQNHMDAVAMGEVDFAYLGPALYIKLTEQNNTLIPLGRLAYSQRNSFRGAIIVRQDSSISSLSDLRGKNFAFGDPNSTLGCLVPQRLLLNAAVKKDDLAGFSHLKNHNNVALAVLMGKYAAGGVKAEVFHEYKKRGLKVLQWTPYIPTHIFVANATMHKEKIEQMQQLLLTLHEQPEGVNILNKIKKGTTHLIPAHVDEYAELRQLISSKNSAVLEMKSNQ